MLLEVDGERIAAVTTAASDPPPGASAWPGSCSRARQRPLARLPAGAARADPADGRARSGPGASRCTRSPRALDPDSMLALARATFAEMALAGFTLVGRVPLPPPRPGRVPYEDPNAMGAAVIQAAREAGIRLTLLDACYLHGGIEPDPVQQRFFDADAEAWAAARRQLLERRRRTSALGAAIHSVRAVQPEAAAIVARVGGRARALPLHAHVSEQPAENEACLRGLRRHADRRCSHYAGALSRPLHRRPRHPLSRRRTSRCSAAPARAAACARRPSAISPTGSGRRGACATPALGSRSAPTRTRSSSRSRRPARSSSTSGWRPACAAATTAATLLRGRDRDRLREPRLAGGRRDLAAGALADLVRRRHRRRAPGRDAPDDDLVDALVFAGAAADVTRRDRRRRVRRPRRRAT